MFCPLNHGDKLLNLRLPYNYTEKDIKNLWLGRAVGEASLREISELG